MKTVYLAHSVHERHKVRAFQLELEDHGYIIYNPFYSVFRLDIQNLDQGITKPWQGLSANYSRNLVWTDLNAVRKSDILLAILPERRTIGIPCEMMFAYLLRIPIYTITESLKGHPWIIELSESILQKPEDFLNITKPF